MQTSRKKLLDRKVDVRDAALHIIATEGEKTEKQYFDLFENPRVRVVVLPTSKGDHRSAPRHVLERLVDFKEQYQIGKGDTLWLMVDVDRWPVGGLSDVCREARQKGIELAISNPCFELWLYLHHCDVDRSDKTCKQLKDRLRQQLGSYNSANLNLKVYEPLVPAAVERAKMLHTDPEERLPSFPGTHVYKVVERLL